MGCSLFRLLFISFPRSYFWVFCWEFFGEIDKKDYGDAKKMSEELQEYSFLNNAFVFEKK